jgi:TonB family protein
MRVVACVVVLLGCGDPPPARTIGDFARDLADARDAKTIRGLLRDTTVDGGLWFDDVTCTKRFAALGEIRHERVDAFASCLAGLHLQRSAREDSLADVVVLTYPPGIEIEARIIEDDKGPWIAWIGYEARRDAQDALPTVSSTALEALRISGQPDGPVDPAGLEQDARVTATAYAWLKVCVDANGVVTGAHVRETSSPRAGRAFVAAAATWTFRPFVLGSQPSPVCAMMHLATTPAGPVPEQLPFPLPQMPRELAILPSKALGTRRGETMIRPNDQMKRLLAKARIDRVIAAYQYCIDESGRVAEIRIIRSSGLPSYDEALHKAIASWTFPPYLDEGHPVPVCSAVTFVYSQR